MSSRGKQKQINKAAASAVPEKKKPVKAVIIACVAVVLTAAVILAGVNIFGGGNNTVEPCETLPSNENENYTYSEYKGCRMASELVQILLQADADEERACQKTGVALTVGEHKISTAEYSMFYYDMFGRLVNSILGGEEYSDAYDFSLLPEEQAYANSEQTWASQLSERVIDYLEYCYYCFDRAISTGVTIDEDTTAALIDTYERVGTYIDDDTTKDELIAETYGKDVTFAMFAKNEIVLAYANVYEMQRGAELEKSVTDEEAQAYRDEQNGKMKYFGGTVYPIPMGNDAALAEAKALKTVDEVAAYCEKYAEESGMTMLEGSYSWAYYDTVAEKFGSDVSDWIYDSSRKAGDIGVVKGAIYDCLVYIEKAPYYTVSHEIVVYARENEDTTDEEAIQSNIEETKKIYDEWVAAGASEEELVRICNEQLGTDGRTETRIGDFDASIQTWINSSERKYGDCYNYDSADGSYIIFFVKKNSEDYDWKVSAVSAVAADKFTEEYENGVEAEYPAEENDKKVQKARELIKDEIKESSDYMLEQMNG